MAKLVIHSYPKNPRVYKALIAGKYNGVEIDYPEFAFGTANKTPEFLAKNPLGQVPVLDTPEGAIWESNAIARYVARQGKNTIYGKNTFEAAQIDQWIDFSVNNIDLARDAWILPVLGYVPFDHIAQLATQKAKETLKKILRVLNQHFLNHTFFVGERVTLADIVVSMALYPCYTTLFDGEFRGEYHNVNRWFQTVVHQPNFHSVLGEVKLCEKAQVATPVAEAAHPKGGKGEQKPKDEKKPKEQKPKEEKPKQADKPKEEKKPAPAAANEEAHGAGGDDEDEEKDQKPKEKNPLDSLPPSKFSMDEWKRMYSNNDTKTVANPWFWQNLDDAGFSLWKVDYKYNSELSKIFMTSNMINGWFQRLEKLHKYAFGSVLIHGKEPNSLAVSGVWLFRGLETPKDMLDCDDSALYTWTKLDAKDAATKTLVDEYWAWEGDFGGKGKPEQGKTFK